ncbi:hypothetical protein [Nitratireductor alexandrii]|uniref:hypothetical protein n=1 Tax=Nitratireductor alexandrii TaxID=2448161 RepID=UPI000FDB9037|nr:hypothetical protein [Nitratireductor alexandrii]
MKRFTESGRMAIKDGNLYCALTLALMIPDICGSMEHPGPGKSQKRYEAWFEKWAEPQFTRLIGPNSARSVFISAKDCFQLRCSLIHSGSARLDPKKPANVDHFLFFDQTSTSHLNSIIVGTDKFIQLRADLFCEELFKAAEKWDEAVANDDKIQKEKMNLLTIHSRGFVYGGNKIKFG